MEITQVNLASLDIATDELAPCHVHRRKKPIASPFRKDIGSKTRHPNGHQRKKNPKENWHGPFLTYKPLWRDEHQQRRGFSTDARRH